MAPIQHLQTLILLILLTTTTATATSSFINSTCAATTYPSLCYKTLLPYSAESGDLKALSQHALEAALKAAKAASRLAALQELTAADAAAVKQCMEENEDGVEELKESLSQLSDMGSGGSSGEFKFKLDNVKTWASAVITDEDTCMDAISGGDVSPAVKRQIRGCIVYVAKLTSNALAIINQIQY